MISKSKCERCIAGLWLRYGKLHQRGNFIYPFRNLAGNVVLKIFPRSKCSTKDICTRIGKATAAFKALNPLWNSQTASVKTKLQIFNTNVKSVLLYACETWRTTKASTHRLQTFLNRCLRRILRIKWFHKVTNEELWRQAGQDPVDL